MCSRMCSRLQATQRPESLLLPAHDGKWTFNHHSPILERYENHIKGESLPLTITGYINMQNCFLPTWTRISRDRDFKFNCEVMLPPSGHIWQNEKIMYCINQYCKINNKLF